MSPAMNHPFPEAGDSLERLTNGMVKAWGRGILQPSPVVLFIEVERVLNSVCTYVRICK